MNSVYTNIAQGTGGDVVYMEEAAFMPLDVFYEVGLYTTFL